MSLDPRILAVDDSEANLGLLERMLKQAGYTQVDTISRSAEVLGYFERHPPDLLLLDLVMPDPDGVAVLGQIEPWIRGEAFVPVLVFTADASREVRERALDAGARDFLAGPVYTGDVLLRMRNLLQTRELQLALHEQNELLEARLEHRTFELDQARLEAFGKLGLAAEYRDDVTGEHTQRVGRVARLLARELGMNPAAAEVLGQVAPLHDLGKIAIPDSILLKPGRLTSDEFAAIKEHARIGCEILTGTNSPLFALASQIALSHHERWDGSGYPHGLAGESIPVEARIVSLVDAFDAMCHARPYKPAWTVEQALEEVERSSGSHFDPTIVEAFERLDHPSLPSLPAEGRLTTLTSSAWDVLHEMADLQLTPNLLEAIFERHPQALVIFNDERRYIAGNAAARELLQAGGLELKAKRLDDFATDEARERLDGIWAELLHTGTLSGTGVLQVARGHEREVRFTVRANVLPGHHLTAFEPVSSG